MKKVVAVKNNKKEKPVKKEERKYEQKLVDLSRVTRVTEGGKRMRFRACVVIGDRKGKVGFGVAKGIDVQIAISKAVKRAEKSLIKIKLDDTKTIPYDINVKFKSAKLIFKRAKKGTGIKAGGTARAFLELAGIENIVAKQLGTSNKINNIQAVYNALSEFKEY